MSTPETTLVTAFCNRQEKRSNLFMKLVLSLLLLFCGVHITACSKAVEENNTVGTPSRMPAQDDPANIWAKSRSNMPSQPIETSSPGPQDVVFFDGKNYIKKSGWKTPPKKDTYKDENYDLGDREGVTKSGKKIRTKTYHYLIRPLWLHSQDFIYEGRELDNMKGKLEGFFFLETSANNKVFSYSISVKKVESAPPSNGDHSEPFVYEIMDSDGDGIFETLLGDYDEIIVPDWVTK
jgi:hypothetical protein